MKKKKKKDCDDTYFDLEMEFIKYTSGTKYIIEPSLINRIGFYDEDFYHHNNHYYHGDEDNNNNKNDNDFHEYDDEYDERLGITNWLTDPRFLFEPGEYWEGKEMFCQLSHSGEWIEDEFYDQEGVLSSCQREELKLKKKKKVD